MPGPKLLRAYLPLALGAAGIAALLLLGDLDGLGPALQAFDLRLLPALLALAVADYAVRFLRWRLLVAESTESKPPLLADLAVFLAANTMLLTPARAGDFTRSLWARELFGTPIAKTAPVPLLERLADVIVMAGLAGAGALLFGASLWVALVLLGALLPVLLALRGASMLSPVAGVIRRLLEHRGVAGFVETLRVLWRPRPIALAFGLGLAAWAMECVMFFVVLVGLSLEPSPQLLAIAATVYPAATLAGSVSLLPGGLGIAEASTAGLTMSMTGADASLAVAAALLIRLAIVGFGGVTGIPGLIYVSRAQAGAEDGAELARLRTA